MQLLTEDEAVAEFARLISPHLVTPFRPVLETIRVCQEFYRNVRIVDATDSMLLECGQIPAPLISGFHDYRGTRRAYQYESGQRQYLHINRQVLADGGDNDHVLSVEMYFHEVPTTHDNLSAGWFAEEFDGTDELDTYFDKMLSDENVAPLIARTPSSVIAIIRRLG